jgi:hypothetical protein
VVGNTLYLTVRLVGRRGDSLTFGSSLLAAFTEALLSLLNLPDAQVSMLNITFVPVNDTVQPSATPEPIGRQLQEATATPAVDNSTCTYNAAYYNVTEDTVYTLRVVLPDGSLITDADLAALLNDTYLMARAFRTVMIVWFDCPAWFGTNITQDQLPGGLYWPFGPMVPGSSDYFATAIADTVPDAVPGGGGGISTLTPTATATASVSSASTPTPTRTKKPRTAVGSGSLTPRPSVSRSKSAAATPSATQTACPTLPPMPSLPARVLTVVRLGDSTRSAVTATTGTALPVYIDIYATNGTRLGSRPLQTRSNGCGQACTLAVGKLGSTSVDWFWDTEGLPSTSADGRFVVLPCHTSNIGAPSAVMLEDQKTIAILSRSGMAVDTKMKFTANTGLRGTGTSWRQAATVDGTSFWTIGVAQFWSGVRYLPTRASTRSVHLHGQTWYYDTVAPGWAQIGTRDIRGMAIANGKLYASSAFISEPSANGAKDPYRPWGGVVQLSTGVPTAEFGAEGAKLLPGFNGRRNWQSFTFVGTADLWALEDMSTYRSFTSPSPATVVQARTALSTVLTHFKYDAVKKTWAEVTAHRVTLGASAFYSLAAVVRGTTTQLFATDRTKLVSVTVAPAGSPVMTTLAAPPTGGHFRGVAAL